ncbi:MAG TPA: hypothetical protein DCF68_07275 [Cyanothece sp. UBA12306]|nr:hypothetical protein [Cyanothece sp. UBA12306]
MPLNYQSKQEKNFSMVDLIIGLLIVIIVIIIALHNLLENPESRQIRKPAERNLRAFAHGNKLEAWRCEAEDNDGDGAVLCKAKNRQGKTVMLKCSYEQRPEISPLCIIL